MSSDFAKALCSGLAIFNYWTLVSERCASRKGWFGNSLCEFGYGKQWARGRDILRKFVAEALGISVMGGLIGLAIGGMLAPAVTLSGILNASINANAVAIASGFSVAVGAFLGIYPARRAAQLNPIHSLQYE